MKAYSMGEVSRLIGIKPHVIRYWEGEMPLLAPGKSLSGRRVYTSREVQLLLRFKHLLQDRKFTLEGAKRTMWEELGGAVPDVRLKIAAIRGDLIEVLMGVHRKTGGDMSEHELIERYTALGHGHLFAHWAARPDDMKRRLLEDLESLDAGVLGTLKEKLVEGRGAAGPISPAPYVPRGQSRADRDARAVGEALIREGRTAFLTVAGGQGTRLGFDGPKGMFPVTPVRRRSLFSNAAEKLLAARRAYGATIPWLIMTSPANHAATVEYFETEGYFGLERGSVHFFSQGVLPSLSPEGGLMLAPDGGLQFNPNGHGGVIQALRASGLPQEMKDRGVEGLFYFQIDNPLVTVPDPLFLGFHHRAGSRFSVKVLEKTSPEEKLGVIGLIGGKPGIIEYSDLPPDLMHARDADGRLIYCQGSPAIHLINVELLLQVDLSLPCHLARKRVKTLIPGPLGAEIVEREAVKFEMFVFDAIPLARKALFFEADRREEFAPLKNREGIDSIETCVRGQVEKYAGWLEACGVEVPRDGRGFSLHAIEISPLFAADGEALAARRGELPERIHDDLLLV